jgi:hypothetical protein
MENLLNPKLTNQERQELLLKSLDKEYRQKLKEHQQKDPDAFCFRSYWKVNRDDICHFNKGARNLETWFDFDSDQLTSIDPTMDLVLLEGDRVEVGEWDQTYNRWSANPYQRVLVMNTNAKFYGFRPEEQDFVLAIYMCTDGQELMYPASWNEDCTPKEPFYLGLLDIPLEMLEAYEKQRTYQNLWCGYEVYNEILSTVINGHQQAMHQREKRKTYKKSNRDIKSFTKSFQGGFGA